MDPKSIKRKFKITGWKEPKRLDEMTVTELMIMRDTARSLSFRYANCERVSDYWIQIEETCQKLIKEKKNNL